jgi:ABC-2 type transport system permease protein
MLALRKTTFVEAKLFLREPMSMIFGLLFPTALLLLLGAIPVLREPSDEYGGARFVDMWAPTALVMGLAILGVQYIPGVVAMYRENGILRRMSTTPVHPATVLAAQLLVALTAAVTAAALLILGAWLVLDVPLPQDPLGFAVAFVIGFGALLALGLLVAALAPTARAANSVAVLVFMLVMFAGGVYLPRFLMPEFLIRMGDYTPPGVQALLDAWSGDAAIATALGTAGTGHPQAVQLGIMALIGVSAGWTAAKLFRWQ